MRSAAVLTTLALLLAGCESSPDLYTPNPRPYTIPLPEIPAPVTEAPLPDPPSYTMLPSPPPMVPSFPDAPPDPGQPDPMQPDAATPTPPPADPDAPRDPVEDVLLKPPPDMTPTPAALQATQPRPGAPPDTGGAVPLMGFRPMRGQKPPGA